MTVTVAPQRSYFRTSKTYGDDRYWQGPDRNKNVIYGAKLIEEGPLNDSDFRPWTVDETTLGQVVAMGSRRNKGLKARFAHPTMSDDGLGTFVGHWRNLRIVGDEGSRFVIGDLHLADSAFQTPRGNLGEYLLNMAEDDPEAFGVSLATVLAEEMYADAHSDEGELVLAPLRFKDVRAADFVDEPAATRGGLFDINWTDVRDLAPFFDWAIDNHFAKRSPEEILAKCRSYLERKFGRKLNMATDQLPDVDDTVAVTDEDVAKDAPPAASEPTSEPAAPPQDSLAGAQPFMEAFGKEQGAVWFCEGKTFEQASQLHREQQANRIADLEKENAELRSQLNALLGETPVPTGKPQDPKEEQQGAFAAAVRIAR